MATNDSRRRWLLRSAAAAFTTGLGAAGLSGCGGGSAADAGTAAPLSADDAQPVHILGVDSGGTGRSGNFFSATVASVAPLVVAGVQFGTGSSTITDGDGQVLAVSALAAGMSAEVKSTAVSSSGGIAQAEALSIQVAEQLTGPVGTVDAATSSFTVLGQRVVYKAGTVFATAPAGGAGDLAVGQLVRVWGQQDVAGARIVATRVDLPPTSPALAAYVLRGPLTAWDRSRGRFAIGGLAFTAPPGLPLPGGLAVGDLVRARLAPNAGLQVLSLSADPLSLPNRSQSEIEGRISAIDSALRFWVDGVRIDATAAAITPAAASLVLGAQVQVQGLANGGTLVASKVQVEADDEGEGGGSDAVAEIEGSISSVDPVSQSFVLRGQTVTWNSATVFQGGSPALLTRQRKVNVKGPRSGDGTVVLARTIRVEG